MQERIWMRLRWTRQFAMITPAGLIKISSTSAYGKCEYWLAGAQAVIIDGQALDPAPCAESPAPKLEIRFDPKLHIEGAVTVTFRLLSNDDLGPWTSALSRSLPPTAAGRHGMCCTDKIHPQKMLHRRAMPAGAARHGRVAPPLCRFTKTPRFYFQAVLATALMCS
jgi:hypothetical protein